MTSLKDNKYLKELEIATDNWDEKFGYLTTNNEDGVDFVVTIDTSKLGFPEDTEKDEIIEALELHFDGSAFYLGKDYNDEPALISSSCEEIFITYEGDLVFPGRDGDSIKLSKDNADLEALVYSLAWMHEHGIFNSIYKLDYYGNSPEVFNYTEMEEYKALSSDDKKQYQEIESLKEILELERSLKETTITLGELPTDFYNKLPTVLSKNDGLLEIIEISNYDPYNLDVTFLCEELEEDDLEEFEKLMKKGEITDVGNSHYKIGVSLRTKAINFIMECA